MASSLKCIVIFWWSFGIVLFLLGIACLVLGLVLPGVIDTKMKDTAADTVVLKESNFHQWGEIPGDTDTFLIRNFTFFDFTNPFDVMFRNKKPVFVEYGPYSQNIHKKQLLGYQELQNFTDHTISEDGLITNFNFWVYFKKNDKEDTTKEINFANFIGLGLWYQLKQSEQAVLCLQAMGALIYELERIMIPTMQSTAIQYMLFETFDDARGIILDQVSLEKAQILYNDPYYGMKNATTLVSWLQAATDGDFSGSSYFLKDFFQLTLVEMQYINDWLRQYIEAVNEILDTAYCSNTEGGVCTPDYIVALQWSSQEVTLKPPTSSVKPTPTVVYGNNTAGSGFPELSYFYNDYFLKNIDSSDPYKGLKFDQAWALSVLRHAQYDPSKKNQITDENVLLHRGNLQFIFEQGGKYDAQKDETYLVNIQKRFKLDSPQQARVLYEYCKYMSMEFFQSISKGGNVQTTFIGTLASQTLYSEFSVMENQLLTRIAGSLLFKTFQNCKDVLSQLQDITDDQTTKFCSRPEYNPWNSVSLTSVLLLCNQPSGPYYTQIIKEVGLTNQQLLQLCDWTQPGFGQGLKDTQTLLKTQYNCQYDQCTMQEIARKQWATGEITRNPPNSLWESTDSVANVYPDLFPVPFEYYWFQNTFKDVVGDMQVLSDTEIRYLLSYDCLFSGQMESLAFILEKMNQLQEYTAWFLLKKFQPIQHYLRYLMVQFTLGGLSGHKTIEEILFGHEVETLKMLSMMDPALGGDPSINSFYGLNLNLTLDQSRLMNKQSMYTGKNDTNLLRTYQTLNGLQHFNVFQQYFDGNTTKTRQINPWADIVPVMEGTDAQGYSPRMNKDTEIGVVITDVYRFAKLKYGRTLDYHGLDCYRFEVVDDFYKMNQTYNGYKWNGIINQTTVQSAPVMVSFTHFYGADKELQDFIEVYKYPNLTERQYPSQWDSSYTIAEPLSGASFVAIITLQINVEYQSDILFPGNQYAIMPILSLYRGGNWTESQVNDNFGDLKTAIKLKKVFFWVGITVGPALILIAIALYFLKLRKLSGSNVDDEDQLIGHQQ